MAAFADTVRMSHIDLTSALADRDPIALAAAFVGNAQARSPRAIFQRFDLVTRALTRSVVPLAMTRLPGDDLAGIVRAAMPPGRDDAPPLLVFSGLEASTGGRSAATPGLLAYRLDLFLDFDHAAGSVMLHASPAMADIAPDSPALHALRARLDEASRRRRPAAPRTTAGEPPPWRHDVDFAGHARRVEAIRKEAARGALHGVNLSIGLSRPTRADPFDIYRACVAANPSPYGYVLHDGGFALVGSSPLAFLQLNDGHIHLETDAGTRPVTGDAARDDAAEAALLREGKDAAEHQVVVDAELQALAPIARGGEIRTVVSRQVRRFSHVMHLYSAFEAPLAEGLDVADALRALAPAAAVSGFPKLDALRFARTLEQAERGPYGGVIGLVRSRLDADFAVVIRSMWLQGGVASLRVGGKVVAGSDPQTEYDEALSKSRFLVDALARAESAHGR